MVRTLVLALALIACKGKTPPPSAPEAALETAAPQIRQSPLDARSYRVVTLDNGLRAVVIHDPDTDKAAAALSVNIGHLADPIERQGLAHFLEHMLFMGTDEFPDVDDYRKFIQSNGGSTNAGTGTESTTYFFDVGVDHLAPAVDRFSRFFVAPKLDAEYVERERNAVNSEYSLKIKEDVRRVREVKKKTRNPAHPYSKFSVGNLDTLGDKEGQDLHADLRKLYEANYVGDNMTLSILGRESLDELEAMVKREFAGVPARTIPEDDVRPEPYLADQLGVEIRILPEKDVRQIELIFPVPGSNDYHDERPVDFLTSLIGDEGEGSLFAALKKRGWVEALRTSEDGTDDFSLIQTKISLTEEGYVHRDEVVTLFFQFIELLKQADLAPLFDEERRIGELNFMFAEETPASRAVQGLARMMPYVEIERLLDHRYRYARFDEELLKEGYLAKMTPGKLRLVVLAPDVETDRVEALYSTPYAIEPLSAERKEAFLSGTPAADLKVRPLNPYIATKVEMKAGEVGKAPVQVDVDVEGLTVWHMLDTSFGVPRAYTSVELFNSELNDTRSRVQNALFAELLDDSLESFRYPLIHAGLSVSVRNHGSGMNLALQGYDEKQPEVLDALVERLLAFEVDPERFELEKEELIRSLENTKKSRPIRQLLGATTDLLLPDASSVDAQLEILRTLTLDDMKSFSSPYWSRLTGRMLVHGNVSREEVQRFARSVEPLVGPGSLGTTKVHHLAPGEITVDVEIAHADSTIGMLFHGEGATDADAHARNQMLVALLRTDFFTELRTKQQLGYVVFAGSMTRYDLPGLLFGIQSSVAGPEVLEERIDAFLAERPAVLEALSDEDFDTIRRGQINEIMKAETRLYQRTARLVGELSSGHTNFDTRERLVEAMNALSREEMVAFFNALVLEGEPRRLVMRSAGTAHSEMEPGTCQYPNCPVFDSLSVIERER